ncbi:solute carrier family 13 member 1-like [Glandiceps talaboti]
MDSASVASAYMKDTIFFILGAFTLTVAMEKWNLHKRLAWSTLLLVGTSPGSILLGFMLVSFVLSMWASNVAVATLMVQIAQSVADEIKRQCTKKHSGKRADAEMVTLSKYVSTEDREANDDVDDNVTNTEELPTDIITSEAESQNDQKDNVNKAFLLGIAYSSLMGGSATLIGSFQPVIMKDYLDTNYGTHVMGFLSWIAVALPCQLVILVIGWVWLQWLFLDLRFTTLCCKGRKGQEAGRGDFKKFIRKELKDLGPIRFPEGSVLAIFLLLLPVWFLADPKIFPGWISLSEGGYVSITTSSIAIPILLFTLPAHPKEAVTAHTMHVNPLYFIVPCTLSSNFAFMFPIASGPNTIAYSYGNLRVLDMVKAGIILNIISIAMVNVCAHTLVVWVFDVKQYPEWAPVINVNSTTPGTLNTTVTS